MLDPDPEKINPDPQPWFFDIGPTQFRIHFMADLGNK
jgi:hypothetical protein